MPAIYVATKELAVTAKWAAAESTPHLHMVLFGGGEYVAMDGHRMIRVPCETFGLRFGVDRSHLLAALAASREIGNAGSMTGELILAPITGIHVRIDIAPGVGMSVPSRDPNTYPPPESSMPAKTGAPSPDGYILDPRYLAAIAEVNTAFGCSGIKVVTWGGANADDELLGAMLFENSAGVRFVVMPRRGA